MSTQHVIIIGGTSGIGKALAEIYLQKGWHVGIMGRRALQPEDAAYAHPHAFYETCDVRQTEQSIVAIDQLIKSMGGQIQLFIMSSGVGWLNRDFNVEHDVITIATNVVGWTSLVNHIYQHIEQQGHGHLAAISSIASLRGLAPAPTYSASKSYQAHYLEALRQRAMASKRPIFVSEIRPGFVDTPLLADTNKFFWISSVDRAAKQIVGALKHHQGVITVTHRWKLIVPVMRLLPNRLIAMFIGKF